MCLVKGKIIFHQTLLTGGLVDIYSIYLEVSKGEKIMNPYNQVPHLTQDTNGKVTNSQLDTTYESQEVIPFPSR